MARTTLREYLQRVEDAISSNRVDDAFRMCQHVLAQFPDALEVQRLLGEVYLAQGQLEAAQQAFDWVLTNDPENVITYCDRALISERQSDFDTALDCYQQAYELSRGNSQIRQQFNQLSKKTGQQGFMLSRAGLARLYLRGGLLLQSIQEWDAVLTVSPERLDAYTGLLESYWRAGHYERVEQLAVQVLQDVPGCLKALLLLAYVTCTRDMRHAQELIQRAEALDPDMLMAQGLFGDAIASQPAHPLLKLLKKTPTVLEDSQQELALASIPTVEQTAVIPEVLMHAMHAAPASSGLSHGGTDNWNGIDTLSEPQWSASPAQEPFSSPSWADDRSTSSDSWSMLDTHQMANIEQLQSDSPPLEQVAHDVVQPDPWDAIEQKVSPLYTSQEETPISPPAWLSMLTQGEQKEQDDESFFFGPDWLKSLGATAMNTELSSIEPAPEASIVSQSLQAAPSPIEMPELPLALDALEWRKQMSDSTEQAEHTLVTTLEGLEQNLRLQGFIPLEPNSLSVIAQSQPTAPMEASAQSIVAVPSEDDPQNGAGSLAEPEEFVSALPAVEPIADSSIAGPLVLEEEHSWAELLHSVPAPARSNALFDSELETTMKRPSVRLQPLSQQSERQQSSSSSISRGRAGELRSAISKPAEDLLSARERLLKGYQHQLVGDYDEAMHEYRVIIRNAPELLEDVVSNMRALLKLAPHYLAGYRVLGDAYMRQGEYLQAMESYNKALTMAKRAKS